MERKAYANLTMTFSEFRLPPVDDALVIGRRAPVGANAIAAAFEEMVPGYWHVERLDHPIIEAVLLKASDIRKLDKKKLLKEIVNTAEKIMDETDTLHVKIDLQLVVTGVRVEIEP